MNTLLFRSLFQELNTSVCCYKPVFLTLNRFCRLFADFLFPIDQTVPRHGHLVTAGSGGEMPAQPFFKRHLCKLFFFTPALAAPSLSAPQISSAPRKNEAGRNQTLINRCFIRQRERLISPGPPSELPSACSPSLMLMRLPLLIYELAAAVADI